MTPGTIEYTIFGVRHVLKTDPLRRISDTESRVFCYDEMPRPNIFFTAMLINGKIWRRRDRCGGSGYPIEVHAFTPPTVAHHRRKDRR